MGYPAKIVTCCYCGARAALAMPKKGRHELACSKCAAPLHELKMLPLAKCERRVPDRPKTVLSKPVRSKKGRKPDKVKHTSQRRRKSKRGRAFLKNVFEEVIDFVEDIFD